MSYAIGRDGGVKRLQHPAAALIFARTTLAAQTKNSRWTARWAVGLEGDTPT
jgi:hypothetical protein